MSYRTRPRNLCKTCDYATKYYGDRQNVTGIWCVKRNGRVKKQPKKCKMYNDASMSLQWRDLGEGLAEGFREATKHDRSNNEQNI